MDQRGVAAIEFAFLIGFLSLAMLNVTDIAIFLYERMEVENAAEMGAQAAFTACDLNHMPATVNCSGLNTAITTAIHSTSLGTSVSLQSGSPTEGWYCIDSAGALQYVSSASNRPSDCSAVGMPSLQPGDYIMVQVTYSFTPLFTGVSIGGLLPTTIDKTTQMRLQ
jgi:Flp pilus assembly protein TadG